jgi:hypothetical protein
MQRNSFSTAGASAAFSASIVLVAIMNRFHGRNGELINEGSGDSANTPPVQRSRANKPAVKCSRQSDQGKLEDLAEGRADFFCPACVKNSPRLHENIF